jgi:hypothetical protein
MSLLWWMALGLQAVSFASIVLVGVALLGASWRGALLAAAIVTPVPLFKVSAGAAGFIYLGDLLGILCLLGMALGWLRPVGDRSPGMRLLLLLALSSLVLLPGISTVAGFVTSPEGRSMKPGLLGVLRGLSYFLVFLLFMQRARSERRPDSMVLIQCLAFWLIALCGLMQYAAGIDLDLWNEVRQLGASGGSFGGGFMGLYRGAVGAWGAGILGAVPAAFANRRLGAVLMPVVTVTIMAAMLAVGSRQGVLIGGVAFVIGLWLSVRSMPGGARMGAFCRGVGGVALLCVLGLGIWSQVSSERFGLYVTRRFELLWEPELLMERIMRRDWRLATAWDNITGSSQVLMIGTGYGVEEHSGALAIVRHYYVDSELFYTWQLGGTVLLLAYAGLLLMLRLELRGSLCPQDARAGIVRGAATAVLYAGMLLMYGHFFLLTTAAHQAPVAYWNWALLGLAVGLRRAEQSLPEPAPGDQVLQPLRGRRALEQPC